VSGMTTPSIATQPQTTVTTLPTELNLSVGYAGELVTGMLQYAVKNEVTSRRLADQYKKGRTLRESMQLGENKRMTAGVLFKSGQVVLDSSLLEYMEQKEDENIRKRRESVNRATAEYHTMKAAAEIVITLNLPMVNLTNPQLKAVVKYKKRKGDAALPSTKVALAQRFLDTIDRGEQSLQEFLGDAGVSL
jgi:hypothetical protein